MEIKLEYDKELDRHVLRLNNKDDYEDDYDVLTFTTTELINLQQVINNYIKDIYPVNKYKGLNLVWDI